MATKLYLRDTKANAISVYRDMLIEAGSSSGVTGVVNTQASGTEIQWTKTGGGELITFISGRSPAGGWTLSGSVTFSIWAQESNMNANCGVRCRLFKRTSGGVETEISSGWHYGSPSEISNTTATEYSWSGTPDSTAFAEDDRLMMKVYIINVGTMAGGYSCTLTYNNADAQTGDAFVQITETVTFKSDTVTHYGAGAIAGGGTFTGVGLLKAYGLGAVVGTGTFSGAGGVINYGSGAFTGIGLLVALGSKAQVGAGSIQGTGQFSAVGWATGFGTAALVGSGLFTAVGTKVGEATVILVSKVRIGFALRFGG